MRKGSFCKIHSKKYYPRVRCNFLFASCFLFFILCYVHSHIQLHLINNMCLMAKDVYLKIFYCLALLSMPTISRAQVQVYFSPSKDCEREAIRAIEEARSSVDIAAFSLTNKAIANAIKSANKKGISVRLLMDKSTIRAKGSLFEELYCHNVDLGLRALIPIKLNAMQASGLQHNKYIIIDGGTKVFTGSYNFTYSASNINKENCLVITRDDKVTARYVDNFARLWVEQSYGADAAWLNTQPDYKLPCVNLVCGVQ